MQVVALYREDTGAYISKSILDLNTGLIAGIPKEMFYFKESLGYYDKSLTVVSLLYKHMINQKALVTFIVENSIILVYRGLYSSISMDGTVKGSVNLFENGSIVFPGERFLIGKMAQYCMTKNYRLTHTGLVVGKEGNAILDNKFYKFENYDVIDTPSVYTDIYLPPGQKGAYYSKGELIPLFDEDRVLDEVNRKGGKI